MNKHLVQKQVASVSVEQPTQYFLTIDCSGSMSGELPAIRKQLSNKLSTMLKPEDVVNIIWFSGNGEYGFVSEAVSIQNAVSVQSLKAALDKWLKPVGLTGFKGPMELVLKSVKESKMINSFLFFTDGYDNQSSKASLIALASELAPYLSNALFVEYGYYANKQLLAELAEKVGGSTIHATDFDAWDPMLDAFIANRPLSAKKIEVEVGESKYPAFTVQNGEIKYFAITNGKVLVGEDVDAVYTYSLDNVTGNIEDYAALYMLVQKMQGKEVKKLLRALGDVKLINSYSKAYGKVKLNNFLNSVKDIVTGDALPMQEGFNAEAMPDENAYTVWDAINLMVADKSAKFYPNHAAFQYSRISAKRVQAASVITEKDSETLQTLLTEMATTKDVAKLKDLQDAISKLTEVKKPVKFVDTDTNGIAFSSLTFNQKKANISVLAKYNGFIETEEYGKVQTRRYSNFSLIADGMLNVSKLPVSIDQHTFFVLKSKDVIAQVEEWSPEKVFVLDLSVLPVINETMVKEVTAKYVASLAVRQLEAQATQKYLNTLRKEESPKTDDKLVEMYGVEGAALLAEKYGITHNGFSPKVVTEYSGDVRIVNEVSVKVAKFSSLPKIEDVIAKRTNGKKMTPSEELMNTKMLEVDAKLSKVTDRNAEIARLQASNKDLKDSIDVLLAKVAFTLIVGQEWLAGEDATNLSTTVTHEGYEITIAMTDSEVKL